MAEYKHPIEDDREEQAEIPVPELPLMQPKPETTRLNRKVVMSIVAIIGGFTAISLIWAFSPQKKQSAEEAAAQQKKAAAAQGNATAPNMPEVLNAAPGTYSAMRQTPPGVPQLGAPLTGDLGGAQLDHQRTAAGEPYYTTYPVSGGGQGQPSIEQQMHFQEKDQKRKDALEARRSPLTFGNPTDFGGRDRSQATPLGVAGAGAPQMPDMGALTAALGGMGGAPADQNMQDEKRGFTQSKRGGGAYLEAGLQRPLSPYEIKAGSIFPGVLITGINSDLPGQIVGQIRENIYDSVSGRFLLIPQGTKIIGEYDSKVAYGQERALIVWTRLILPNGDSISLEGMPGVDLRGYAGLTDKVNNHYMRLLSGVVLGSVLGAAAQVAVGPAGVQNPNFEQLAVAGAAQNINDAGQQITRKNLNIQPTIEIRPGMKFNVFVTKDLILRPYRGR